MVVDYPICASCGSHGTQVCGGCRLVLYCSGECQKAHWQEHKKYCKSPLIKSDWQPEWIRENRVPTFVVPNDEAGQEPFGGKKFFWGNVPAFDMVDLANHESKDFAGNLRLLFAGKMSATISIYDAFSNNQAASGDLRNVFMTLASLPSSYSGAATATVNDLDFETVARNIIMLLIMLSAEDRGSSIQTTIHLWYSAFLRQKYMDFLGSKIRPLVQDVVSNITSKASDVLCGKTWAWNKSTLRVELTKARWIQLLAFFDVPPGLSTAKAHQARKAVNLASSRIDYRERRLLCHRPAHRVVDMRYGEDGVFAPFGYSREEFTVPNPTFFQGTEWPMKDSADPVAGWSLPDLLQVKAYGATNDLHGQLYFHLQTILNAVQSRVSQHECHFQMLNCNATELPSRLKGSTFARIETANIADSGYLGVQRTHATLVTLFINAVPQLNQFFPDATSEQTDLKKATSYLCANGPPKFSDLKSPYSPMLIKVSCGKDLVHDMDKSFERYMQLHNFKNVEQSCGVRMKPQNTIIEKWPMRLKLEFGQPGAQEEFDLLLGSSHTGSERYVEWTRQS
ncbi:Zinc finger MYND domain-containing protein 10 [Pseudocercospora fuligena]|uniref:Zinc finger MYND domain-containing protein 10 n=1 Tax=Pseudocercospora fuligena TaxID=685502 RepID=A0A8H6RAK5_9PEZI|nr:Zinc finger MYND domain-containing protein 10 [Pseudocercospora fuligena]